MRTIIASKLPENYWMNLIAQVDQDPWWFPIVVLAGFVIVGVVVLYLFRAYNHLAERSLKKIYASTTQSPEPREGFVLLQFHTYHGFIGWFSQAEHNIYLPASDALRILNRLLRFNLTWGLFTWGAIFIVILSLFNYVGQRRSISHQLRVQT